MKIAILTIHSDNYGNRLQNYALQTVLERGGITWPLSNAAWALKGLSGVGRIDQKSFAD